MNLLAVVENILQNNQKARDSDRELIVEFLQAQGAQLTDAQVEIIFSVSFESLTRARRKLQEQGKYLPSPEVASERRYRSLAVRQVAPTTTPGTLQHIINNGITYIGDL